MIGANLPTFPVFPGVSKPHQTRSPGESIKSTAPGKHLPWPFPKFFHFFVILEMSKRKIKQEVDLVLLFELILIRKRKTEQSNWYIFNEYRNWSEINQSNCTMHARKLARFSHAIIDVGNIRKAFVWFSESIRTLSELTFLQYKDF